MESHSRTTTLRSLVRLVLDGQLDQDFTVLWLSEANGIAGRAVAFDQSRWVRLGPGWQYPAICCDVLRQQKR